MDHTESRAGPSTGLLRATDEESLARREAQPESGPSRNGGGPEEQEDQGRYRRYREREDRGRQLVARGFAVLTLLAGLVYLGWVAQALNPEHPIISGFFLLAEVACLGLFVLAAVNVWSVRYKPKEGLAPDRTRSVDVFVTVCGEPLEIVGPTLRAVSRLRWDGPLDRYVLDDGNSEEVREVCDDLGLVYLSREEEEIPRENAKAGNLNFGLSRSEGELVFVLDADHVPHPDALRPMAGYMRFPDVAFVQSKQSFDVPEGDPFNSLDPVFYEAVQLANDADDSVISCGSGVLYRRAALEENGGFATWNLVEDLTTSYDLHARGWKSFYYPHAVTKGLAPRTIQAVYQQRSQWALDTMRLFLWDNPLFKKGLGWRRRLNHLMIGLSYIWAGFIIPIFFLVPIWTYLTGEPIIVESELHLLTLRLVYFVFFAVAAEFLFRRQRPGKQFQFLAGLFPVYLANAFRALAYPPGRRPSYRVNNVREGKHSRWRTVWKPILPQLTIFVGNAVLPFYAIARGEIGPWAIVVNVLVSAFALWTLWPVILESVRAGSEGLRPAGAREYGLAS